MKVSHKRHNKLTILAMTAMVVVALRILTYCYQNYPSATSDQSSVKQQTLSTTQLIGRLNPEHYFIASSATWDYGNGAFISAFVETKKSPSDTVSPDSRITIKNVSSDKIIYEMDFEGGLNYMYIRNLTPDDRPELIVDIGIAASSNQFQVLSVTPSQARLILDVNYIHDVSLVTIDENSTDVLVTTGLAHAMPYTSSLYRFEGDRYKLVGRIPYNTLLRFMNDRFKLGAKIKDQ
jgi:hypothetical protein